jgi:hypothetical protein
VPGPVPRSGLDMLWPGQRTYDVTPAGKILGITPFGLTSAGALRTEIRVVLNWFEDLKARAPTK